MEQLQEDTLYFLLKSELLSKLQYQHRANANNQTDDNEMK